MEDLVEVIDRVAPFAPEVQSALKGPYPRDAVTLKLERHPGAGRLVRSRAVQHDVPVPWQLVMPAIDLLGWNA